MDLEVKPVLNYNSLAEAMEAITPWFQNNVESITDPLKCLEFLTEYARMENELFQLLVDDFEKVKNSKPEASKLWLPQSARGL
jgi:hypothetical protein